MIANILWFLGFGAIFFFMMRKGGCGMHAHGGHQHGDGGAHAKHDRGSDSSSAVEVGDPVCGMTMAVADAVGTSEYGGELYHFCSIRCHQTFLGDPERYTH